MEILPLIMLTAGASALAGQALPRTRSAPSTAALAVIVVAGVTWLLYDRLDVRGLGLVGIILLVMAVAVPAAVVEAARRRSLPDQTNHDMDLDGIHAAAEERRRASETVRAFTQTRNAMPIGERMADSFIVTQDEESRDHAERTIGSCDRQLATSVPGWVVAEAFRTLAADPTSAEDNRKAMEAHAPSRRILEAATSLHGMAAKAESDLEEAISALSSASTMEVMDAVSSNKAIAMMSHSQNQAASDAVETAQRSVDALKAETDRVGADLSGIDDTLDLILDLAFDGVFDFMSFVNIGRIDAARRQCEQALAAVRQERLRLHGLMQRAQDDERPFREAVDATTSPHLAAAAARLPEDVRALVPPVLPLPEHRS